MGTGLTARGREMSVVGFGIYQATDFLPRLPCFFRRSLNASTASAFSVVSCSAARVVWPGYASKISCAGPCYRLLRERRISLR
jgi:hypothetical protein